MSWEYEWEKNGKMHQYFSFMCYAFDGFDVYVHNAMKDMTLCESSSCQLVDWECEIKIRWDIWYISENKPNSAMNPHADMKQGKSVMILKKHKVKKITCML